MEGRHFFSKLLLFGEYTVLLGSDALALPFHGFSGHFVWGSHQMDHENGLAVLHRHVTADPALSAILDVDLWKSEIEQGIYFHSTIPAGYGLGSSGALVAACYDRYGKEKNPALEVLKQRLASMENAFHGASSGMDPLVSYTNTTLLFKAGGKVSPVESWQTPPFLFLLDTTIARSTSQFVSLFTSKMASETTFRAAMDTLTSLNQEAIPAIIQGKTSLILSLFAQISTLQLAAFREFIPEPILSVWETGLAENTYFIKLCGAGGGGMMLVYAPYENIQKLVGGDWRISQIQV